MITVDLKSLIGKLSPYCTRTLEAAAGMCVSRGNYEVTIEHFLLKCLDDANADIQVLLRHYGVDEARVRRALQRAIEGVPTGNSRKPVLSSLLVELFEDAWLIASVELGMTHLRSGATFVAALARPNRYIMDDYYDELKAIAPQEARAQLRDIAQTSSETTNVKHGEAGETAPAAEAGALAALNKYAINFTEKARAGEIDPVFGRDREIRQMIDILARRRKNNPIAVGEAGVGKTAVVEGLAVKIVESDVPDILKNVELYGLDLGLLQAGASVKGEFEQRLKSVISEVKASPKPIILFIDEAHTLIGAGGAAGGGDAANLLKPALARGELRTVAATTWSEYKKYFEKDPALARRFQLVKIEEPTEEEAVVIMRGVRAKYEQSHGVYVRDDAIQAAAKLSARFISGRQLPDKAVDLLDTACARVKISISSKPDVLEDMERQLQVIEREIAAIKRDVDAGIANDDGGRIAQLRDKIAIKKDAIAALTKRWQDERAAVEKLVALRKALIAQTSEKVQAADTAARDNDMKQTEAELQRIAGDGEPLVIYEVTPDVVGKVVSDWTGIPVGDMVKDEARAVLSFADNLRTRIKGQDQAIAAVERGIKASKAGLNNPRAPIGVFLFVGPSGVGKTETALGVSDLLFGGERSVVTINMSEFQEKHTLSRLVGSPPGYVGYGEGGVLTEAVRQRPYSVVLLDEVEKADLEVMNLFYQVFDKGMLADGEGRIIDFKNTVVILTSNLASDVITQMCTDGDRPTTEVLTEAIRPILSDHFRPALLARMEIVPFFPIDGAAMKGIVDLKLQQLGKRMHENQRMEFAYDTRVVEQIVARCTEVESGARNIDHIINRTLIPQISTELLTRLNESGTPKKLALGIGDDGNFTYQFVA